MAVLLNPEVEVERMAVSFFWRCFSLCGQSLVNQKDLTKLHTEKQGKGFIVDDIIILENKGLCNDIKAI